MPPDSTTERLDLASLVDRLLVRDADVRREALAALEDRGDERTIPHLVELVVIDVIGGDWERFDFPEVLREHAPPRYLELPEARWPGVGDALAAIARGLVERSRTTAPRRSESRAGSGARTGRVRGHQTNQRRRHDGTPVEQDLQNALRVADRGYVLRSGRISLSGDATELGNDERVEATYLGG